MTVEPIALIVLCVAAGGAAGAVVSGLRHRRETDRMRRLLERLERLAAEVQAPQGRPEAEAGAPDAPAPADSSLSRVTADVLAGRTTYVEALLARGDGRGLSLADQAILRIYEHLREPLSPAGLARSLNVSLRSLERGLSLALGCTPRELITAVKMREARRLLQSGELNVAGVAARLAFSSPSHFSRSFRRFYGRNPSELTPRGGGGTRPGARGGAPGR